MKTSRSALIRRPGGAFVPSVLVSSFGDALVPLALAFAVLKETGSIAAFGLALAASRLPQIVTTLVGGVVGDRARTWLVLRVTATMNCVLNLACAMLLHYMSGVAAIYSLVAVHTIAASVSTFSGPAAGRYLRSVYQDKPSIDAASSFIGTGRAITHISAQAFSGVLVYMGSPATCFLFNSVTFLFLALSVRSDLEQVKTVDAQCNSSEESFMRKFVEGLRTVRSRRPFALMLLNYAFAWFLMIQPFLILGPAALEELSGSGGPLLWGGVGVALGVGGILGGAISNRITCKNEILLIMVLGLVDIPLFVVLATNPGSYALHAFSFAAGVQSTLARVLINQQIYAQFEANVLSRVHSLFLSAWLVPAFVASLCVPALVGALGMQNALMALVVSFVIVNAVLILAVRRAQQDQRSRVSDGRVDLAEVGGSGQGSSL